jgi:phenylalanyl-tRNA synthetase beta chain
VNLPEDLSAKEVGLKLTMATVEIDGIEQLGKGLENIVVGKILAVEPHPNADKLRLVTVDLGSAQEKVVCGGSNLREGILIAFAKLGAKVRWHGEGESVEIIEAEIRGVKSRGMICASTEIGLEKLFQLKSEKEILDLSEYNFEVGASLADALGLNDALFEVDNKSMTHRSDLWGHYGLARELSALYGAKLKEYDVEKVKATSREIVNVEVEAKDLCPRYMAARIDNIKVAESPLWLKTKLFKMGVRPINNIVDITNYLLFELGQPLHAFDANKLSGNKIIVRRAFQDETMVTLDQVERKMTKEMLVIADAEKAVAIAGVMGGENSEISENTTSIVFESATFRPENIRKTANGFDLRTEAAVRFEKSLDPNLAQIVLQKAVQMVCEFCPDAAVSEIVDAKNFDLNQGPIEITWDFINSRIGEEVREEKVIGILESLGFDVSKKRGGLSVKIPTWRATKDISIPEDLVEEVARIIGYDNITPKMPVFELAYNEADNLQMMARRAREVVAYGEGATEVYNYSFDAESTLKLLEINQFNYWQLANALDNSRRFLRQSLVPNLLENVVNNLRFRDSVNLFEIGKTFSASCETTSVDDKKEEKLPDQNLMIGGVVAAGDSQFSRAKGIVENLLNYLSFDFGFQRPSTVEIWAHPQKSLDVIVAGQKIGFVAELHPAKASAFGLEKPASFWQVDLLKLSEKDPRATVYQKISKYPEIVLDVSFMVDEKVYWMDIYKLVLGCSGLIKKVELLDVYQSDKIEIGKKSVTIRAFYQSDEHTLTTGEARAEHAKLVEQLEKGFGIKVR